LPLYLTTLGLGPAVLGMIEGVADLLVSLSKLGGGVAGHYVQRKRAWAALGYLVTSLATSGMALARTAAALVALRGVGWIARGFRSPLRDYLLADAVAATHYGRAYGLERAGDMLGAVTGPLLATLLVWGGIEFRAILLWAIVPGALAAGSIFFLARQRPGAPAPTPRHTAPAAGAPIPRLYWTFLIGVLLFGLGDFSRTFLIWLAARQLGESGLRAPGTISVAVMLYMLHNLISAAAAYPVGRLGDRRSKIHLLVVGYAIGVLANLLLAIFTNSLAWLVVAIVLSGIYISVEETLEKAVAAELLPRELRSLGFGVLAAANAFGDMASSLYVGFFLEAGRPDAAFGIAAGVGMLGVAWLAALLGRQARTSARI
jgi:MFS family permease